MRIEGFICEGKAIREIMDENTQICGSLPIGWEHTIIRYPVNIGIVKNNAVLYAANYIFIFNQRKLRALFYVQELIDIDIDKDRSLLTATGRETSYEYWFDNGEYHWSYIKWGMPSELHKLNNLIKLKVIIAGELQ